MSLIDAIAAIPFIGPTPGQGLVVPSFSNKPLQLAADLWLGPVPQVELLLDACEHRGHNSPKPFRQFASLYGFYRTYEGVELPDRHSFDPDRRLRTCLQLSRLVRPTSVSYEFAGQIWGSDTEDLEIIPAGFTGVGSQAFVLDEDQDWFRDEDGLALRDLLSSFEPARLPPRLHKALWYHEYLSWIYLVDVRWPLGVTALEALVHTDESDRSVRLGSTEQFVRRLLKLREFIPSLPWTEQDLSSIYDRRSALVHGVAERTSALEPDDLRLMTLEEEGLRTVLLASIRGPETAAIFETATSVRTYLGF
jgi:hypothetical protein